MFKDATKIFSLLPCLLSHTFLVVIRVPSMLALAYVARMQDEANTITSLLPTVQWAPLSGRELKITLYDCFTVDYLLPSLSVLRGLRFVDGTEVCLTLKTFSMKREIMTAQAGLPDAWTGALRFEKCTWPLPASEYTQLAQYVPTSYTEWHVECKQPAVLDSIRVGINEARARLGARPLTVYAHIDKVRRVGEHVVLKHAPGQ